MADKVVVGRKKGGEHLSGYDPALYCRCYSRSVRIPAQRKSGQTYTSVPYAISTKSCNPLLAARNREVVKSVLGFAKLCVHSPPTEVIDENLP